jgi:hypothetical protein
MNGLRVPKLRDQAEKLAERKDEHLKPLLLKMRIADVIAMCFIFCRLIVSLLLIIY